MNMVYSKNIIIILLIVMITYVAYNCIVNTINKYNECYEHMVNITPVNKTIKWGKDATCKYQMTQAYLDILKEYSIDETSNGDWSIYFPCTYNNSENEIKKVNPTSSDQRIFIVNNSDAIASKSNLWKNIVTKYGREEAKTMSPISYVLYDNNDLTLFKNEYKPENLYIMKKNVQRQEGLKITNNKDEILDGYKKSYVVAQELLQDPYIIKGRKTNLRFYVLLVCQNNEISLYIHKDGFMYYTKMPFVKNTLKMWSNVTTGYIERWIYHINPLTHEDFRNYLDNHDRELLDAEKELIKTNKIISEEVFLRIYNLIKKIIIASDKNICNESKLKDYISFQLFGADIAIDDKLNPKIMEFNIGPNLATHDGKDSEIKHMVIRDILKTIKVVPDINNGFIRLI